MCSVYKQLVTMCTGISSYSKEPPELVRRRDVVVRSCDMSRSGHVLYIISASHYYDYWYEVCNVKAET